MLSIIICSINPTLIKQVSKNIEETIGLPFEIITIDNQKDNYGICEAYNLGATKSKYEYLCFMHEDILFHTKDWGKKLVDHFADQQIGVIGVAGGVVKSAFHSSWWYNLPKTQEQRKNLIQHSKAGNKIDYKNPFNEKISDVLFVDGVFMACEKKIWKEYPFDSLNFPKFHFYDLDFSFNIYQKHRVIVIYDILIEHLSSGAYKADWIFSAEKFTEKWKPFFPLYLIEISDLEKKALEIDAIRFFRDVCIKQKLYKKAIKTIWHLRKIFNKPV